jgi:hypothetical protein
MNKTTALKIISDAALIYKDSFINRNILVVFGDPKEPECVEIKGSSSNYLHLTGMKINKSNCKSADTFFSRAIDSKLSERDFDFKDGSTIQKLQVLKQVMNITKNANMIGDYSDNSSHIKLSTHKLAGNVKACIGLKRNGRFYIPNTVLNTDIRNETVNTKRILLILSKSISEENYSNVEYVAKGIDADRITGNSAFINISIKD